MSKRVADFQLMELIEQELAFAAEADLAVAEHSGPAIDGSGGQPRREEPPWRGIEEQMKSGMPKRRRPAGRR